MERLTKALNAGKRRGYNTDHIANGRSYWIRYAIKKIDGGYMTYFSSIDDAQMAQPEDFLEVKLEHFPDLESALANLRSHGAEIRKLTGIKLALPF